MNLCVNKFSRVQGCPVQVFTVNWEIFVYEKYSCVNKFSREIFLHENLSS